MTTSSAVGRWARGELDLRPMDNPAKYSTEVLLAIDRAVTTEADRLGRRLRILDPMAGVGRIHRMGEAGHLVVAAELEPEWALWKAGPTVVADANHCPYRPGSFDVLCCSPVYGNRMADHHNNQDRCKHLVKAKGKEPKQYGLADCPLCRGSGLTPRNTYHHKLGRAASRGSTTPVLWGPRYRSMHQAMAPQLLEQLTPGGLLVWNSSNSLVTVDRANGEKVELERRVNEWWTTLWLGLGCNLQAVEPVTTRRNKMGANGTTRVDFEVVTQLRAPAPPRVVKKAEAAA